MNYEWRNSNGQEYLYVEAEDHYQLGVGVGKGLKKQIFFMKGAIQAALAGYIESGAVTKEEVDALVNAYAAHIPQKYMDEIRGMYDGLKGESAEEIRFEDVLMQNVFINAAYRLLSGIPAGSGPEGCTNFAAINPDGTVVHGQNYDSDIKLAAANAFVHQKLPGEPEMFLFRTGADLGTACGKNAEGVSMTVSVVDSNVTAPIIVPRGVLVREAMKEKDARSAMEAVTDEMGRSPFAYNLIISDQSHIVASQAIPQESRVTWVKRTIVQSNRYDYTDWVKYMKQPSYSKKRQLYGERLLNSIYDRYGRVTEEDLLEILADEPVICRTSTGEGGGTVLFLTRNSFGLGPATGAIGKLPF